MLFACKTSERGLLLDSLKPGYVSKSNGVNQLKGNGATEETAMICQNCPQDSLKT